MSEATISSPKISEGIPAPTKRTWEKRLTDEMKNLTVGQSVAPLDAKTRNALRSYARFKQWVVVTKKIEGSEAWQMWRTA